MYMTLGNYIKTMRIGQYYKDGWISKIVRQGTFDVNGRIVNDINYPLEYGDKICWKVGKNRNHYIVGSYN